MSVTATADLSAMTRDGMFDMLAVELGKLFDEFAAEGLAAIKEGRAALDAEKDPARRATYLQALYQLEARLAKVDGYKVRAVNAIDLLRAGTRLFINDLSAANAGAIVRTLEKDYHFSEFLAWERAMLQAIASRIGAPVAPVAKPGGKS